jgi:hypothetical protein
LAESTRKAPTASELAQQNEELRERVDALGAGMVTLYAAIASLEFHARGFKPVRLGRPENAALRAVVSAAPPIDAQAQPYVLPAHTNYAVGSVQ